MSCAFNLLHEPWIPVLDRDGRARELGLLDALTRAHELIEVRDALPIVEFGINRLLVALVTDIYQPTSQNAIGEMIEKRRFDEQSINDYFEKWGDRFDLFHPRYPFLQCAEMDSEEKPLSGLMPCIPSGTAANHFHHAWEDDFQVSPSVAARLLTTIAPFMTAGGRSLSRSINGDPPWYALIRGDSLFETLCLNLCSPLAIPSPGTVPPAWRNPVPVQNKRYTEPSLLEGLTWRPRRIRLVPGGPAVCSLSGRESPVTVNRMNFTAGAAADSTSWRDPSVPYKSTEKGRFALRPQPGREVWRDTGPLALLTHKEYKSRDGRASFERPAIVTQYESLTQDGWLKRNDKPSPPELSLVVYGMRADTGKVLEWQREELSVPVKVVMNTKAHRLIQEAIDDAGSVEYHIGKAIKTVAREGKGNSKALDTQIRYAERSYWSTLRGHYEELLRALADLGDSADEEARAECLDRWKRDVTRTAWQSFRVAVKDLDTDRKMLRSQMLASRTLALGISRAFETLEEKAARKGGRKG